MASAWVMFMRKPSSLTIVSRVTRPSESAASATVSLMVEQGSAPGESASFWLTMARMRPLEGSIDDGGAVHVAQGVDGGLRAPPDLRRPSCRPRPFRLE